ncbi:hypothetical protein CCHR01_16845 [Colletotrichum chrysophilum]|uniref:DUF7580 domain-containing protein n=1 Tax=Colletotrichum chrysophilum TaxID=1836956 RepID=A0AAD9A4V7_9PEZI|nr:hypothetical protein CCHR01_16845 [Colletotrichum chrysophilum]
MMKYHENLIRLLDPIVTDNDSLMELIRNPDDSRWKDGSLEALLENRLSSELDRFFRTIKRMQDVMMDLNKLLQIQDGKAPWLGTAQHNTMQWHCKRLQLSFSKGKDKKVRKLAGLNQVMQEILGYSERTLPISDRRKTSEPVKRLEKARQHACSVYNALRHHWKCAQDSCSHGHKAHLRLCSDGAPEASSVVLVWGTGEKNSSSLKPKAHEVVIQTVGPKVSTPSADVKAVHGSANLSKLQSITDDKLQYSKVKPSFIDKVSLRLQSKPGSPTTSPTSPSRKSVTFAELTPAILVTTSVDKRAMEDSSPSIPFKADGDCPGKQQIQSLCAFLEETSLREGLLDEQLNRRLHVDKTSSVLRRMISDKMRLVSLPDLLHAHHEAKLCLPRQTRFEMAAHMSSAFLHAYPSPWMSVAWTKNNFYFLVDNDSQTLSSCHPFLSRSFRDSTAETSACVTNLSEQEVRDYLVAVGIIVLELIFGHDIRHCTFRNDYLRDGQPNEFTDVLTAKRWAKKVLGESGPNIADVVRRCLDCSFGPRPVFSDVRFRESVYEGVIKPLATYSKIWPEVIA